MTDSTPDKPGFPERDLSEAAGRLRSDGVLGSVKMRFWESCSNPEVIFEPNLAFAVGWKDGRNVGDIVGTRKRCLGMVPELLTDARETSYVI